LVDDKNHGMSHKREIRGKKKEAKKEGSASRSQPVPALMDFQKSRSASAVRHSTSRR